MIGADASMPPVMIPLRTKRLVGFCATHYWKSIPCDICPVIEAAAGRPSGRRQDSHFSIKKYFTIYFPPRTDFCYRMTARPIVPESRRRLVQAAVALCVGLAAGCIGGVW
jgi:hypothetical protein